MRMSLSMSLAMIYEMCFKLVMNTYKKLKKKKELQVALFFILRN